MRRSVRHLCLIFAAALTLCGTKTLAAAQPSFSSPVPNANHAGATDQSDSNRLTQLARRLAASAKGSDSSSSEQHAPSSNEQKPLGPAASSATINSQHPSFATGLSWSGGSASNDAAPGIMTILTSLGLVIALIFMLRWGWAKMGGKVIARNSPVVEILARTSIAPKNHIVLVRIGGRILVVGDSPSGLRPLAQIEDPDEIAGVLESVTASKSNSVTSGFSQLLSRSDEQFDPLKAERRLLREGADHTEFRFDRARESVSSLLSRIKALSGQGGGT